MRFKVLGRLGVAIAGLSAALAAGGAGAQTNAQLLSDAKNPADVLTYGMGYNAQRYTSSKQITAANVKNLVPVWNLSLDNSANASTQPLVVDGVMYVATHNATVAVDAVTGKTKWKTPIELPADINGFLCCGIHTRGLAAGDGLIFRTTLDAHVMAINAADGKQVWKTKAGDYKKIGRAHV